MSAKCQTWSCATTSTLRPVPRLSPTPGTTYRGGSRLASIWVQQGKTHKYSQANGSWDRIFVHTERHATSSPKKAMCTCKAHSQQTVCGYKPASRPYTHSKPDRRQRIAQSAQKKETVSSPSNASPWRSPCDALRGKHVPPLHLSRSREGIHWKLVRAPSLPFTK